MIAYSNEESLRDLIAAALHYRGRLLLSRGGSSWSQSFRPDLPFLTSEYRQQSQVRELRDISRDSMGQSAEEK